MAITRPFNGPSGPATCQPGVVLVAGRVAIGGSGAVGTQTGKGFSVAKASTGTYTVTITANGGVPNILAVIPHVGNNSASVQHLAYHKTQSTTAGTVTIITVASDTPETPADPATGAVLEFIIAVQNLGITS